MLSNSGRAMVRLGRGMHTALSHSRGAPPATFRMPHMHEISATSAEDVRTASAVPAIDSTGDDLVDSMVTEMFADSRVAFYPKSMTDLLRAYAVFTVCGIDWVVENADKLVNLSNSVLGESLTNTLVKKTFFAHFCAGEDETSIEPTVTNIKRFGVGGILDYAAEADLEKPSAAEEEDDLKGAVAMPFDPSEDPVWAAAEGPPTLVRTRAHVFARTYDYVNEQHCDANLDLFIASIQSVKNVTPEGFAAIKVTALGNPKLLERVTTMMDGVQQLFALFDGNKDGLMSCEGFKVRYKEHFTYKSDADIDELFALMCERTAVNSSEPPAPPSERYLDPIEWTNAMTPAQMSLFVTKCVNHGACYQSALSEEELELYEAMEERVSRLCAVAQELDVKVLIDAEQTYFQPAIDSVVLTMQRKYNMERPIVYNTYQCYLKQTPNYIALDMERSRREGWFFAGKLVRGAYMVAERARAADAGVESPIHETLEDTHKCYNDMMKLVLDNIDRSGIMIASHNADSCARAVVELERRGIDPQSVPVFFGQLLGMADHLTFALGARGLKAYKYVPYGPVGEVMPYLIRRAQENASMLGNLKQEKRAIGGEIFKRVFG